MWNILDFFFFCCWRFVSLVKWYQYIDLHCINAKQLHVHESNSFFKSIILIFGGIEFPINISLNQLISRNQFLYRISLSANCTNYYWSTMHCQVLIYTYCTINWLIFQNVLHLNLSSKFKIHDIECITGLLFRKWYSILGKFMIVFF